jgi:hypothetical protein
VRLLADGPIDGLILDVRLGGARLLTGGVLSNREEALITRQVPRRHDRPRSAH